MLRDVRYAFRPAALIDKIRRDLRLIDPSFAISDAATLDEHVSARIAAPSIAARLSLAAAAAGVLLAMMGLYSVLSYLIAQRRTELAIRMSIGAGPREIAAFIGAFGLKIVIVGLALGIAGARVASGLLVTQLPGVETRDPVMYVLVIAFVVLAACAACFVPARRAARLEPWIILGR